MYRTDLNECILKEKWQISLNIVENPYSGFIDDEKVKKYHKEYSGEGDKCADDCRFPDKFMYETVKAYLWEYRYNLFLVSNKCQTIAFNQDITGLDTWFLNG